jgi:hypothetical protein
MMTSSEFVPSSLLVLFYGGTERLLDERDYCIYGGTEEEDQNCRRTIGILIMQERLLLDERNSLAQ